MTSMLTGRPLRIAHFCEAGRLGEPVLALACGMAGEGAAVDLFCPREADEPLFETVRGVRVYRASPAPRLMQIAFRALRKNPPDVIHAHGTSFSALVGVAVARILKRPLVTTVGDVRPLPASLSGRLPVLVHDHSLGWLVLNASDRVIDRPLDVQETLDVYIDALAERELRWFLQQQAA